MLKNNFKEQRINRLELECTCRLLQSLKFELQAKKNFEFPALAACGQLSCQQVSLGRIGRAA